jgi:hypothetical protein
MLASQVPRFRRSREMLQSSLPLPFSTVARSRCCGRPSPGSMTEARPVRSANCSTWSTRRAPQMTNKTSSSEIVEIYIEPTAVKYPQKGPCYNARLQRPHGEIIACSTEPLFAACRELVKRGITGHVRKYRNCTISMQGDIEHFAGLTVCETDHRGPEIRKWRRLDTRSLPRAFSRVTVHAPAAVSRAPAGRCLKPNQPNLTRPLQTPRPLL